MESKVAVDTKIPPLSLDEENITPKQELQFSYKKALGFGIIAVFFLVIVTMIGLIKFSEVFSQNLMIFGTILLFTASSIIYYFHKVIKLSSTETALHTFLDTYLYEDEAQEVKGYLISKEVCDFFSDTIDVNRSYGRTLGKALIYKISSLSLPFRYIGQIVLAIGLIGTLWGIFIPFLHSETLGEIKEKFDIFSQSLTLILGSSLMGIIAYSVIQIFEWRFNHFTQSLILLVRDSFSKHLKNLPMPHEVENGLSNQEDKTLYKKLFELTNMMEAIKNNTSLRDADDAIFEKLKDMMTSVLEPHFEKIDMLSNNLSTKQTDASSNEIKLLLEEVVSLIKNQDGQWRDVLQQVTKDITTSQTHSETETYNSELKETVKEIEAQISKLHQEAQKIDLGVKSLNQSQHIHKHDIANLKTMLSDELNHIKIERSKPMMFMPVTPVTEKNNNN